MYCRFISILTLLIAIPIANAKDYGFKVGDTIPNISSKDINGKSFDLSSLSGPAVLVFYRGGWCPYCNLQLHKLQEKVVPEAKKVGAKIVAISVDKVDEAVKTRDLKKLDMTIISDSGAKILKSYNLVSKVPQKTVDKYKNEYDIDLEAASGRDHHIIAIPATFVVDKGKVTFAFVDENYKVRAKEADVVAALKELAKK